MDIVVWRVTEKWKSLLLGSAKSQIRNEKVRISTSGPVAKNPDGADGSALNNKYGQNTRGVPLDVPEAPNDKQSSKNKVFANTCLTS